MVKFQNGGKISGLLKTDKYMKILIIGLGNIGSYILENISNYNSVKIEVYNKNFDSYQNIKKSNITYLNRLEDAIHPEIIFITANSYTPEDRLKYLEKNINNKDINNFRDDEGNKNLSMFIEIIKNIKHLNKVPLIITANPPELLIKIIYEKFGWVSTYNMQMMIDNKRISLITNLPDSECLCIGEHGNPVPTISHLKINDDQIYKNIDIELSKITKYLLINKGIPPLDSAKEALNRLIESILSDNEINCVLTTYDKDIKIGIGKPFKVKGLEFKEQLIPILSDKENLLYKNAQDKLIHKWVND